MITLIIIIGIFIYLVIGRIIAEKKWEWDGYDSVTVGRDIILTTIFWPIYLVWRLIHKTASIFIDM